MANYTKGPWKAKRLSTYQDPGWVVLWPDNGGAPWRRDHYDEGPVAGVAHPNCDGCACGWPVRDGVHVSPSGRHALTCTANRYQGADK